MQVLIVAIRFLAFASVAMAAYVVVGRRKFPMWWYSLFFRRDNWNFQSFPVIAVDPQWAPKTGQ